MNFRTLFYFVWGVEDENPVFSVNFLGTTRPFSSLWGPVFCTNLKLLGCVLRKRLIENKNSIKICNQQDFNCQRHGHVPMALSSYTFHKIDQLELISPIIERSSFVSWSIKFTWSQATRWVFCAPLPHTLLATWWFISKEKWLFW